MAFVNQLFPNYPMIHGLGKTIINPVDIVSNGNIEYRVKRQVHERFEWSLPSQTMTNVQKEDIKSFLTQRNSALDSFKFIDPDAAAWDNARLPFASGDRWKVTVPFNMVDQSIAGTHPLYNPDTVNWSFTVNGSAFAGTPVFSIIAGEPVVTLAGTSSGNDIRVSGPIHFTVRLNGPISYSLAALNTINNTLGVQHNNISLIEVFGEQ